MLFKYAVFIDAEALKKIYSFGWKDFDIQNNLVSLIISDQEEGRTTLTRTPTDS